MSLTTVKRNFLSVSSSALYVSRFRLFHNGYLNVARYILGENKSIVIAIGATQQPPCWDNPFSGQERAKVVQIDETGIAYDEWASLVERICPPFDRVYSNSELVRLLFSRSGYQSKGVPISPRREYSFEYLREGMVQSLKWEDFVPQPVVTFIKEHRLDERVIKIGSK